MNLRFSTRLLLQVLYSANFSLIKSLCEHTPKATRLSVKGQLLESSSVAGNDIRVLTL